MARLPIYRSSQSNRDLIDVWSHIAKDSPAAASLMLRKIDKKIELLATHPYAGELQPQFGPDTRRTSVGSYLVFYQLVDNSVRVMRVFHSAQKWEDLL